MGINRRQQLANARANAGSTRPDIDHQPVEYIGTRPAGTGNIGLGQLGAGAPSATPIGTTTVGDLEDGSDRALLGLNVSGESTAIADDTVDRPDVNDGAVTEPNSGSDTASGATPSDLEVSHDHEYGWPIVYGKSAGPTVTSTAGIPPGPPTRTVQLRRGTTVLAQRVDQGQWQGSSGNWTLAWPDGLGVPEFTVIDSGVGAAGTKIYNLKCSTTGEGDEGANSWVRQLAVQEAAR